MTLCGHRIDSPGHICAFFDSREQEYDVLSPYFLEGLEQGEEVLTIVDAARGADHRERMRAQGIPVDEATQSGRLVIFASEDTYTHGGRFEASRIYDLLQTALAEAKRRGRRVRTAGVMDWSKQELPGTEQLMEYEARVNVPVPIYECTLLCVYDLAQVSGRMMMDILMTHPYLVRGKRILQNPYYTPPLDLLKQSLFEGAATATGTATAPPPA